LPEPTVCTECRALLRAGRWTWDAATPGAYTTICPACRRIADDLPAGYLEILGNFFRAHQEELRNLIRNIEEQEKSEYPLERIMALVDEADRVLVTTTGIHLARRIGEALAHAYQGELDFAYGDGEQSIRVVWRRD
jgi:hypothetical protein